MSICRKGSIYRRQVGHGRDECGEVYRLFVEVTAERNGYAIWAPVVADEEGLIRVEENEGLYLFHHSREHAIERAVGIVAELQESTPVGKDEYSSTMLLIDDFPSEEPEQANAPEHAVEHAI